MPKLEVQLVNLWDAETIDNIQNIELLHPKLKKFFFDDILVRNSRKLGIINVYVDIFGSMTLDSGVRDDQNRIINKTQFAMAMVLKLREMQMLNELYFFNSRVKKVKNDLTSILTMHPCGTTNLNKVVEDIVKKKENAVVITDAEDHFLIYSEYAYFIGVAGAMFRYFDKKALKQYVDHDQCVLFNGGRIYKINHSGYPVL